MKGGYAKPIISKLRPGVMNLNSTPKGPPLPVKPEVDGVSVSDLAGRYGSPLFVYSEHSLRDKYRIMQREFSTRYPDVALAWSYKTNYLQAICAVFHQEGAWAEVVSEMEYLKALSLGVPPERILYNGPYKPRPILEQAMRAGSLVNVDHLDELEDLEEMAFRLGRKLPVGIRVNLDAGISPMWTRFGFNLESGQAMEVASRIADKGLLELKGLHCHLGTYIMDPGAYGRQAATLAGLLRDIEMAYPFHLDYLDLGGGFPSASKLRNTYLPPDLSIPDMGEYAEALCTALLAHLPPGRRPKLILESGRALVDEAGSVLTSVTASKRLPDGARAYVLDAGVNLLPTSAWYRFGIALAEPKEGLKEYSVLYGPLCMNIDVVDEGVMLPPLDRGDLLLVSPAGAYNQTQSMQFIHLRPASVMVNEQGGVDIIRRAEDLRDLQGPEQLPDRLLPGASLPGHDRKNEEAA